MILSMMPFSDSMNLGQAYNEAMALLPEDGWAIFLDHDAMWTTRNWHRQISEAIAFMPDAGAFTAMTNRIASPWQQIGDREDHDIRNHRRFGKERMKFRTLLDVTGTNGMGGVVLVLSKAAWRKVGGFVDGLLCVDHRMHFALRDAGLKVWLMENLYTYHWRRACGDDLPADAPFAKDCPCRGPERTPRTRVSLP